MISASTCARSRPVITANSTSVSNSGGLTGRAQPSASASSVLCRPRPSSSAAGRVVSHGGHRMPGFVGAQQSHCCSFKDVRYGLQASSGNVSATCRLTVPAYRFRVVRGGPLSVTADAIAAETSRLRPPRAHCWAVGAVPLLDPRSELRPRSWCAGSCRATRYRQTTSPTRSRLRAVAALSRGGWRPAARGPGQRKGGRRSRPRSSWSRSSACGR